MITIIKKDGEKRIINEHPLFHVKNLSNPMLRGVDTRVSPERRCMDIASDTFGDETQHISLSLNGHIMFKRGEVLLPSGTETMIYKENPDEVKALKKEHKDKKFTLRWKV